MSTAKLQTCSEVISLSKQLENESNAFYQLLSEKYPEKKDLFISFVNENARNVSDIERAYYGVISDAIECCFAFNIQPEQYSLDSKIADRLNYDETISKAISLEEMLIKFYVDGAEQSDSLMADIARVFKAIARKRSNRIFKLNKLIGLL